MGAIGPLRRVLLPRYAGRGAADHVALTFDDGPQRLSTPRFLDVLADQDVRATFFVLGAPASSAARELGMSPVLWTAWGRDWTRRATPDSVRRAVLRARQGGATVLLHDADTHVTPGSWWATAAALPGLLRTWQESGLRVGPLREHGSALTQL
jgi:peptidoglycan/xylan/chitin deacetylase (PgdA/CDA1 family)